ncbi:helix-turn-helix domain-containing protein [Streptomyces viridosporus]|uniref:helix-turn-helix domain-containing protein n=1 Tax=Streptomyces viridosporus TaxID=67581 RepID=UPI0037003448
MSAAEAGVSRACPSKWKNRYDTHGEAGLQDHPSVPLVLADPDPPDVVERIEQLRRNHKWSARRIALELVNQGVRVSERTVNRWPARLGIDRRRFLDPGGSAGRRPSKRIVARQHHRHGHAGEKAADHGATAHRQPG